MYGCVWLLGQTQPWLPRAKVGLFVAWAVSGARLGLASHTLGAWPNSNERIGRSILAWLGLAPATYGVVGPVGFP
jgi:hypothetical protein